MKKSVFMSALMLAILLTNCKKEDPTSFQVVNKCSVATTTVPYLDGTMYEVTVFCFRGSDVVREVSLPAIKSGGGKSEVVTVEDVEKVKVSFKLLPPQSSFYSDPSNKRLYTVTSFSLAPGENTVIELTDQTFTSGSLTEIPSELLSVLQVLNSI